MKAQQAPDSKGLEKLKFLTDKAARLVLQLEAEEKYVAKLKEAIRDSRGKKSDLSEASGDLKSRLDELQQDRDKFDERISRILNAIGELEPE